MWSLAKVGLILLCLLRMWELGLILLVSVSGLHSGLGRRWCLIQGVMYELWLQRLVPETFSQRIATLLGLKEKFEAGVFGDQLCGQSIREP